MISSLRFGKAYQIVAPNKDAALLGAKKLAESFKAYDTEAETYYDMGLQTQYVLTGKELGLYRHYQAQSTKVGNHLKEDLKKSREMTAEELLDPEPPALTPEEQALEDEVQRLIMQQIEMCQTFQKQASPFQVDRQGNKIAAS